MENCKTGGNGKAGTAPARDRRKGPLFTDAGKLVALIARVRREVTDDESGKITSTYHALRRGLASKNRDPVPKTVTSSDVDMAGICGSATATGIGGHAHVLTPGRRVGARSRKNAAPRRRIARRVPKAWDPCTEDASPSTSDRRLAKIAPALFHPDLPRLLYKRSERIYGPS